MLNSNHKSSLRVTFQSIDDSLARAIALLDSSRELSPFNELVSDASPVQRRVVEDYASRIRSAMRQSLETYGIAFTQAHRSSIWAAQMQVLGASIALEEIDPKRLRGYGEISETDANELIDTLAPIGDLLDRVQFYLSQGSAADLGDRIQRLSATSDEVELLRTLERIITERGLIELRGNLEMLLERMESNRFEIAVFGRVSSGKSSLLNYILDTNVLPVGVTPVTAVPTRIQYGPEPQATIEFAESAPLTVPPSRVIEFASEQENPANTKHVLRIEVELPAQNLRRGIVFVDTPGIGSLALSGAAESMAYLPRCDLGIVLVDSASTLNVEDVAIVDLLQRAGASVQILLSKADVLNETDERQATQYAEQQLQHQTGFVVPVFPVSVRGEAASLCNQWLKLHLSPMLARHHQLAHESLCRKIGLLRDAVAMALRSTLHRMDQNDHQVDWSQVKNVLANAISKLDSVAQQSHHSVTIQDTVNQILEAVAKRLANTWEKGLRSRSAGGELIREVTEQTTNMAAERARLLHATRAFLAEALRQVAEIIGSNGSEDIFAAIAEMPLVHFNHDQLDVNVKRTWQAMLGQDLFIRILRKQLNASLRNSIEQVVRNYSKRLDVWCARMLREMQQNFTARADFYRAMCAEGTSVANGGPQEIAHDLAELERLLEPAA
jgi:GTP-binding protein EngB required for normal cell division